MDTEVIIHIGSEKTGTTSLQKYLFDNASRLLEERRVLYPYVGPLVYGWAHYPVVSPFVPAAELDFVERDRALTIPAIADELNHLKEKHRPQILILSAEHFSSRLSRDSIGALAKAVGPARIIYFVRPQDELAVSAFSTALRVGGKRWLDLNSIGPDLRFYNFEEIAQDWEEAFGQVSVRAMGHDVVQQMFALLGLGGAATPSATERMNESVSFREAKILRAMNDSLLDFEGASAIGDVNQYWHARNVREEVLRQMRARRRRGENDEPLMSGFSLKDREALWERFSAVNAKLAEKYGVWFERQPAEERPAPGQDWVFGEGIIILAEALMNEREKIINRQQSVDGLSG